MKLKLFLFSILYLAALMFDIAFMSFVFGVVPLVSLWVFVSCGYFLKRQGLIFFCLFAVLISSFFFSPSFFQPLSLFVSTMILYCIKSVEGFDKKIGYVLGTLAILAVFELSHAFFTGKSFFTSLYSRELALNAAFFVAVLSFVGYSEFTGGFKRDYRI